MAEGITKTMRIGDVVKKYPETRDVFLKFGIFCFSCPLSSQETIEQGAQSHGIDADALVRELNDAVGKAKREK